MVLVPKQSTVCTEPEQPKNNRLERTLVAFDGGNRTIQWVSPSGTVFSIPSFIKAIDPTLQDAEGDDSSVVITANGETFVVGQLAKDLKGTPVFADDKIKLASKLVLCALEPNPGNDAVRVSKLAIAIPNSRNQQDTALLKAIEGTHEFQRNGKTIVATVRSVEPVDETRAAYKFAVKSGMFLSKQNLNGVLDLGGGTSIIRLYGLSGSLIREADIVLPGTFDLARAIASRIAKDFPFSPDLTLIMDGIERGDYLLGTTGYCFENAFLLCRDEWLTGIRSKVKTQWTSWLNSLGEVLIIGGSAKLATPLVEATKGRFKMAPNPQTFSILGMQCYGA